MALHSGCRIGCEGPAGANAVRLVPTTHAGFTGRTNRLYCLSGMGKFYLIGGGVTSFAMIGHITGLTAGEKTASLVPIFAPVLTVQPNWDN